MFHRFLKSRFFRITLWSAVTLGTLLLLLLAWANWSGKRRWAAVQVSVRTAGESLDFWALQPQPPATAQNLLAIEPLDGIAGVIERDASKGAPGAKRKALEALKLPTTVKAPPQDGVMFGKATAFQDWVVFVETAKYLPLPAAPAPDARAVLTALDARFPVLKELADASLRRPLAAFTPPIRDREIPELLLAMPLPHYGVMNPLGQALGLRAQAAVAARDSAEATRSILVLEQLAHASREDGLLIGFLVGASLESRALEALWHGLRDRVFAEADLLLLQRHFAGDEVRESLLRAMRGEMACGVNAITSVQQPNKQGDMDALVKQFWGGETARLRQHIPSGLLDHWKSSLVELDLRYMIEPLKQGLMPSVRAGEAAMADMEKHRSAWLHPDRIIAHTMLPTVSRISLTALMVEARRRQAGVALALERFRLKRGTYPAALDALVPEFLPGGVPGDPCDDKPLRYAPPAQPAGSFRLWSVALDEADDHGRVNADASTRSALSKPGYQGDWTWQYEPTE